MIGISTPLGAAEAARDGLTVSYDSPGPVYACLNREPATVSYTDAGVLILKGARDISHVLVLPAGSHRVHIAAEAGPDLALDFVSLVSSSLIVAFGTVSILALALLYFGIRVKRFYRSRG